MENKLTALHRYVDLASKASKTIFTEPYRVREQLSLVAHIFNLSAQETGVGRCASVNLKPV